jgi:Flp pilus assembly protein protease CpaA|tara:strand:- start:761 stop:1669 length:909 start_codon:yes stop_codon:yes gene_type:complete
MVFDILISYSKNIPVHIFIPYTIGFFALLIGSYTDLRTREVPDWVNLGLIGTGFGINILFSIIYWKLGFILDSVIGFSILFVIAMIMFYTGQWGGGDSKILMGLGALIGIHIFPGKFPFLGSFLINALLIGALYGIFWSILLIFKNRNKFVQSFKKNLKSKKTNKYRKIILISFIIFIFIAIFTPELYIRLTFLYLSLITILTFYLWLAVKAVENSCMLKYVLPKQLTEGDWIVKEIKIGGKYITGPKDLGIEKKQINKLISLYKKKKVNKILIKEGIPFVPSFFIAYVVTLIFGNLVFLFF